MNQKLIKIVNKIKKVKPIKLTLFLLVIILIVFLPIKVSNNSKIKKQNLPQYKKIGLSDKKNIIKNDFGELMVAETDSRRLYIDTTNLNIRVEDINSGISWNSICTEEEAGAVDKSPILIEYVGKDGTIYKENAYECVIKNGDYVVNQIENGVQILFDFKETGDYKLDEYIPQKISIERYEEVFVKGLEEKYKEGLITSEQLSKFNNALKITYAKDIDKNCYFQKSAKVPPTSLVKTLIELTDVVGYTTEMLIEDSQEFGIMVDITEPARFIITMELTLDEEDLIVRIPTYELDSKTEQYKLQNITVLPSFGVASAKTVKEGYIFVPDGTGALFKLNTFNPKYPEYVRPIYNNTYYDNLYEMSEFLEDIHIPVFGMYYDGYVDDDSKKDIISQGFMGIVEEGTELGYINVQLGTVDTSSGGTPYNKVCSSFDVMQNSRVKIFGPYSDNDARYLATTGLIDVDYTVRYKFFPEKATYYDMAVSYRDYILSNNELELSYSSAPKFFFDVIGALTVDERFLGIPYKKQISMTEYMELLDILKDMETINKIINYRGFFNGGMINTISNKASTVSVNGTQQELDKLVAYCDDNNDEVFYEANLIRIHKKGSGFRPRTHALHGFDSKPIEFMSYNYPTGYFNEDSNKYYLLNPLYLTSIVESFLESSSQYMNIFEKDMGSTYYANYNSREIVDPIISSNVVKSSLNKLVEQKTIALNNPNADKIKYAKYSTNISRESSDYATLYCSVPFRQLVMNGITQYTTLDVNMSYERDNYFLLQALELGSIPKFTISAKSVDLLKDSAYTDYYSIQYNKLKDDIKTLYDKYAINFKKIGTTEIIDHEMIMKNVFKTTYASGTSVFVNYNKFDVILDNIGKMDALDYYIESDAMLNSKEGGE